MTQAGRAGPFAEDTSVPATLERRLEGVPGVIWARKFIHFNEQFEIGERRLRMCIVGLDYPADTGSWVPLVAGRGLYSGHYEAIADRSLGFPLRSQLRIARDVYTVVGITSGQVDMNGDGLLFVSISTRKQYATTLPAKPSYFSARGRKLWTPESKTTASLPSWSRSKPDRISIR